MNTYSKTIYTPQLYQPIVIQVVKKQSWQYNKNMVLIQRIHSVMQTQACIYDHI